ncbi:hypothetical protein Glove_157g64 [Diversispora epigaea]|uniref:CCHC-type domain-containing protein n=1 Tax=Diversispora epigaea TaxID=1348612 RepID=A0A397IVI9_9GLOM|nr:hypothetical protein Glove_157g64 [Diversispora epigaea]
MTSEISSLRYRIQKLRETMALDMRHLPSTNTPVFNLIIDVRANIKFLADSARGDNTLLKDEIDNFQVQAELGLTKIQNGCYTFENEVTQLRQEVINLRDINLNQQELTNELGTINETFKEQIDDLTDKNETIQSEINEKTRLYDQAQDRLDECREENYQLRESLQGAHENITEKFNTARTAWRNQRNRNQHITRELQNCRNHGRNLQIDKVLIEFWRDRIILRYEKWKNKTHGARQIINNLNQQIFALQNNPLANPINMAGIQDVMTSMAPLLAQIPQYIGQEPPDDYINKVIQVFSYGTGLGVGAFDDAVKANILKSKMSGKYAPVPAQHPAETRQASLTKLTQEKFLPTDIPETYEERIRLLLLQTPNDNDDALAILWNHLPDELHAQILDIEFNTARTAWRNQRNRNQHITRELQNCRNHGRNLQIDKVLIEFWRDRIILRYEKWKNKTHGARQIINNLNQQIFALQNNPLANPINMAGIQDVMTSMAPLLAQIPQYIGQEPPDDYINKVIQVFSYGTGLGVGAFDDAVKANILKSKMSGKYAPVPAQHPAETRQASLTKLTQEKFLPTDIPETYEERIRLLLLQTPNDNDDALAILWNHLPDELFSRMENGAPADIDAFFTNLKNIWLKRQPSTFTYNGNRNLSVITTNSSPIPYQLQPQEIKNRSFDHLDSIAERLGYSDNASRNPDALANFIEDELYSRLGHANYNLRKEPFGQVREDNTRVITRASTSGAKKVYATNKPAKKPQKLTKVTYKCSNCGKIGHRKNKCPKLGKKPKKVNYTYQSEPENSDQEDEPIEVLEDEDEKNDEEDEESITDTEPQNCFNEVFLESLKYMISELVPHCPKEILIEARPIRFILWRKVYSQGTK